MDRPDRRFDRSALSLALDLAAALQQLPIRLYELLVTGQRFSGFGVAPWIRQDQVDRWWIALPLSDHYGLKETEQAAGQCFGGEAAVLFKRT